MASLINISVEGTLAEKPVVRRVEGERQMVGLSVCSEQSWYDEMVGGAQQRKEWHQVVITDQRFMAYAEEHLAEGDAIHLEGDLCTVARQDAINGPQSITYVALCREENQLRRVSDGPDRQNPNAAICMLASARDARMAVTVCRSAWREDTRYITYRPR